MFEVPSGKFLKSFEGHSHHVLDVGWKADGQLLAKGLTTWGFIELATGRPRRIDQELRVAFAPYVR